MANSVNKQIKRSIRALSQLRAGINFGRLLTLMVLGTALATAPVSLAQDAEATVAAASDNAQLLDRIVAVVNDGVVLKSELDLQVRQITKQLTAQGVDLPPRDVIEKQILERLIVDEIQMQRADRLGIRIDDDTVNQAVEQVAERNNVAFAELPVILASEGVDYITFRDGVRREITLEQLRSRDLISRINVTKEEAERYLARQAAQDNNEYEISQILLTLPSDATPDVAKEVEDKIKEIHRKLEDGAGFGNLAVSYSNGQRALEGGKIGWRRLEEMPRVFSDQVSQLEEGDFSDPIRSGSGFHIVRVDQKRGDTREQVIISERHGRHILLSPNELRSMQQSRAEIEAIRQRIIDGEDFAVLAKELSDDTGSAAGGGDLGWMPRGALVPPFEAQLFNMDTGVISEPVETQFGWHIIELLDVREADKTDEAHLNQAANEIRQRKVQEESEGWLLRMRDEAFVEYRL